MEQPKRKGRHLYWWGLLGLMPYVGFIAGLILFFKGLIRYKNKNLVIIGIADILFTVLFFGGMRYEVNHGNLFTQPEAMLAQSELNSLVKNIEFYKIQHGVYPDSLKQIDKDGFNLIYDPLLMKTGDSEPAELHYKKIRDKYTLFSVGIDKIPYTKDDIYPTCTHDDTVKFGFVKK